MKALTRLFGAAALMVALSACAAPLTYSAKDIRGQIIDAETGEPIEGAIVVAQWVLFHIGAGHGGHKSRLHIYETVTDKEGRYFIPGWGPKVRPPMTELANRDPEILIFKSGYEPKRVQNSRIENSESLRVSEWDGLILKLERISRERTLERYSSRLNSFYGGLVMNMRDEEEWKKYPRMTRAVYAEYVSLKSRGLRVYRPAIPYVDEFN